MNRTNVKTSIKMNNDEPNKSRHEQKVNKNKEKGRTLL